MKKRIIAALLIVLLVLGALTGCTDDETAKSGGKWTVMMYLCGTDLESEGGAATGNLQEILDSSLSDDVNYVIQTGGTSQWNNEIIDSSKIQRFIVENGELVLKDEQELASMGDPSTLTDFINWTKSNYSADKYMLSFWNHGGGSVGGVCFDELYDSDSITVDELSAALSDTDINFELIGFDTCLMATLETAEAVSSHAKYMVASEEYEPGGGWNYTQWLDYLSENTDASGADVGKKICDSYYEKCKTSDDDSMATLSVIDLAKITALSDAFESMACEMSEIAEDIDSFKSFSRGAVKAENYGGNTESEGYTNMVDLYDLASKTKSSLADSANGVLTAISDAVVYKVNGSNRTNANGISVFYPLGVDSETLDNYAKVTKNAQYLKFIDAVTASWSAPDWVYESVDELSSSVSDGKADIEMSIELNKDGYFEMTTKTGLDYIQSVGFELYYMDEDTDTYLRLGSDNDIDADWDKGVFTDNFRGVWATVGDNYAALELVSEEDDYNIYSIPVILNGKETNLRAVYDYNEEKYSILGAYDGIDDNGMSSRDIYKLKDGDKITFLFTFSDGEGNETNVEMGEITYNSSMNLTESELFDGYYLYKFVATDVFGAEHYSDVVMMEYKDGELFSYQ